MSYVDRSWVRWHDAWSNANSRFYGSHLAEQHFLTSVELDNEVARQLATMVDQERPRHAHRDFFVIDVGSGSGQLLEKLRSFITTDVHFIGVDVRKRPTNLSIEIDWHQTLINEATTDITGLNGPVAGVVIAHEFLDDLPCDIVELDDELAPRVMLVDPVTGAEEIGPRLDDPAAVAMVRSDHPHASQAWLDSWWPATAPSARREIGLGRQRVWSMITSSIDSGLAIAIDYAHTKSERKRGLWDAGTVKGFSDGRPTRALPDGTVNITAHVALDALATPRAQIARQAEVLGGSSLSSWPTGLGSYTWLVERIEPIEHGTMTR